MQNNRWGVAPSLALGLGTPTRLTVTYLHQTDNDIPDYGIPWFNGRPAPVARDNYYGFESDYLKTDVNVVACPAPEIDPPRGAGTSSSTGARSSTLHGSPATRGSPPCASTQRSAGIRNSEDRRSSSRARRP